MEALISLYDSVTCENIEACLLIKLDYPARENDIIILSGDDKTEMYRIINKWMKKMHYQHGAGYDDPYIPIIPEEHGYMRVSLLTIVKHGGKYLQRLSLVPDDNDRE